MVQFRVLGPLEVRVCDLPLDLGGFRIRALLALLAASAGRVTSVGTLADALWGTDAPPDAHRTVRTYMSRLRRSLSPAVTALGGTTLIVTHPAGYALRLASDLLDTIRFRRLAAEGRDALAASQPAVAAERLSLALALWRGDAYGEFADIPPLRSEATRLDGLRLTALEDRADAELAVGAGAALVDELTGLTERHPGRDRLWMQLMIALCRAGRQAEALEAYARARTFLVERFGLDPSPRLVETHKRVLDNDIRPQDTGTRAVRPAQSPSNRPLVVRQATVLPGALVNPRVVGRDRELELLGSAVVGAREGRGGAVFIVGEPGLGKTRLMREATRIAAASALAVVQGRATSPSVQFRPLAEALFSVLRHSGVPDDPELGPYLHALSRLVPEWRMQRVPGADDSLVVLAEAVLRLLRRLGRDGGCLVVLDDLQDADADTLTVIDYLVDNLADEPVLLVGTVRPDPGRTVDLVRAAQRRGTATVMELSHLDDGEVRLLIAGCMGVGPESLPVEVVDRVLRDAEGNPFYVEELLAGMVSRGDLVRLGGNWRSTGRMRSGVPATVLASVTARVERLGPRGLRVLRSAAVFGQRFPASLVRVVAEVNDAELLDVLRSGVDSCLIGVEDDSSYSFRHALTLEALRAGLLPQERAALAYRAAQAIEAAYPDLPDDWSLFAGEMWQLAGERFRAAELLGRAGRRAAAQGGLSTAVELLERSLALAKNGQSHLPPATARVLEALFDALIASGQVVRATELSAGLGATATSELQVTVHLGLARAAAAAGEWHVGRRELDQARLIVGPHAGPGETAPVDVVAAQLAFTDPAPGRLAEAEAMAARALAAATRADLPEIACESLEVLGTCARVRDLDEAEALFGRALDIAVLHKLALWRIRVLFQLGAQVGIRAADTVRLVEARTAAAAAGALVTAVDIVAELAVVHLIRGEYGKAERCARECEDTASRLRLGEMPLVALGLRICVEAHQGRRAAATGLMTTYERLGGAGCGFASAVWGFGLAFCSLLEEDREQALADFGRAAAAEVNRPPQYVSYSHGPRLLLAVLEGKEGWPEHAAARSSASGQARWNRLFLALAAAVLASRDEAADAVSEATADFQAQAQPFPLAYHLGLRLLGEEAVDGGWGEPAQWLRAAEAYFHAMPALRIAAACRALLRRAGEPVRQRRHGTDAVPSRLRMRGVTVREHEVLTLVADRLSNREISERLVISRRTVDTHVRSLLAKTDQPNRRALARWHAEYLTGAADVRDESEQHVFGISV